MMQGATATATASTEQTALSLLNSHCYRCPHQKAISISQTRRERERIERCKKSRGLNDDDEEEPSNRRLTL